MWSETLKREQASIPDEADFLSPSILFLQLKRFYKNNTTVIFKNSTSFEIPHTLYYSVFLKDIVKDITSFSFLVSLHTILLIDQNWSIYCSHEWLVLLVVQFYKDLVSKFYILVKQQLNSIYTFNFIQKY